MKKTILFVIGLMFMVQAEASTFRPYFSCFSFNKKIDMEIGQNVNPVETAKEYSFKIKRRTDGSSISIANQNAVSITLNNKNVLAGFRSYGNSSAYHFSLIILNQVTDIGYRSYFSDNYGRTVVYCSRILTFGR